MYIGTNITDLYGLKMLTSIGTGLDFGGDLTIINNDYLETLTGLDNLISIGGTLEIRDNSSLISLSGLKNLEQLVTKPIAEPQTEIDISNLPSGIYIVKAWNDKDLLVQKVVKQ